MTPSLARLQMKLPSILMITCLGTLALAQQATPPPKKDTFKGFGGTALDQPPRGKTSAPVASGGSAIGSSLDQRPPGARYAQPVPSQANLSPLAFQGLNFEAKTVANWGGQTIDRSAGATGSSSVTKKVTRESRPVIELQVRNVSRRPGLAHMDWFFVAQSVSGGGLFVWDKGERDVSLDAGAERAETIESSGLDQATKTETHGERVTVPGSSGRSPAGYSYSRGPTTVITPVTSQERSGARPNGWIVRMFVEGKLVKVQASSNPLEVIGRDSAQLENLLSRKPAIPSR